MPPIELVDETDELEPEPEGVPKPEYEDDELCELEPEPVDVPNADDAAEARAEFGDVNPPGTFILKAGCPSALALEARGGLPLELSGACEPLSDPADWPRNGWVAKSLPTGEDTGSSPSAPPPAAPGSLSRRAPPPPPVSVPFETAAVP
jgi:hypothetical protein